MQTEYKLTLSDAIRDGRPIPDVRLTANARLATSA